MRRELPGSEDFLQLLIERALRIQVVLGVCGKITEFKAQLIAVDNASEPFFLPVFKRVDHVIFIHAEPSTKHAELDLLMV